MSSVRVLVGTRKGAFILTSDGKRQEVGRQRPALRRLGDLPPQGLARRSEPHLRLADERLVRADHPALRRRRQDLEHAGQPPDDRSRPTACPRARATSSSTTRAQTGKPLTTHRGTTARSTRGSSSASGTSSRRSTDPDTVYAGVEDAAIFRTTDGGKILARAARPARPRHGREVAARRRRHVPAHDPPRSDQSQAHLHRHLRRRAPSAPTTAARPGSRSTAACTSQYIPDPTAEVGHCVHRIAMHPSRPNVAVHAEALGRRCAATTPATSGARSAATCRPTSASPSTFTPTSRRRSTSCRSRATREHFPPEGKLRVYRSRTGGNEWEPLTNGLPQENCYVNVLRDAMARRLARHVRHLLRHHRRPGLLLRRRRRHLGADRPRSAGGAVGRSADAEMTQPFLSPSP